MIPRSKRAWDRAGQLSYRHLKCPALVSTAIKSAPVGGVAVLTMVLQPALAMEQLMLVGNPDSLSGSTEIRPDEQPSAPADGRRQASEPPRWEMVAEEPPSRWSAPSGSGPTPGSASPISNSLSWELVVPAMAASPTQPAAAQPQLAAEPSWEPILPGEEITSADVTRVVEAEETARQRQQTAASARDFSDSIWAADLKKRWFVGFGGGLRIGIGEPDYPMAYGRLAIILSDEDFGVSLRPNYIFGNSDSRGKPNNQGAFQMPLTFDFLPYNRFSPFFGLGIANNTDSNGKTKPMATAGLDINIARYLTLTAAINVIYQQEDEDNREVEALTVLYFRF